jgi:flagellar basal body-associated protein FliL
MTEEYGNFEAEMPEPPKRSNTALIIGIIVLVLFCCCCIAAASAWYLWTYGDEIFGLTLQAGNLLF